MVAAKLPQPARRIGGRGHGCGPVASRRIGSNLDRRGIRQANSGVQLQMVFSASRAVAFPRILIAQAGQLVASANAITVARLGSRFNWNQSHRRHHPFAAMLPKIAGADKGPNRSCRRNSGVIRKSNFGRAPVNSTLVFSFTCAKRLRMTPCGQTLLVPRKDLTK